MNIKIGLFIAAIFLINFKSVAQVDVLGQSKVITTAVPFLLISPDARHAGLGDAGVASSPDANASYWNVGKLVQIDQKYGGTLSYTPWLGKIINDMSVSYLSGFYKLTREQAFSIGLKYFDLGDIFFTQDGFSGENVNPREYALDLSYSRLLSENLSIGITGRYIHSNLTGAYTGTGAGEDAKPGKSVAADIGLFYTKELQTSKTSLLSLGATITNIGAKVTYSDDTQKDFLPTNLRVGGSYKMELNPYNSFTFLLDFNKLMVPSVDRSKTYLSGIFGSFTDAPGGFSEEMSEFIICSGVEYWYREAFAARIGYFNESYDKGNRKYLTLGAGFRKEVFGFDVAYLAPTNKREHPLAETFRFTLIFKVKETQKDLDDTVTD